MGAVGAVAALGRLARPFLRGALAARFRDLDLPVPGRRSGPAGAGAHGLVHGGDPLTNAAAARVLDRLGVDLVTAPRAGCCGAVPITSTTRPRGWTRRGATSTPGGQIEGGCEAILVTASGCGVMVKDYGALLADDPGYAERAARVSALARDPAEYLAGLDLGPLGHPGAGRRIAFHPPCTLQHGQGLPRRDRGAARASRFHPDPGQ